MSWFLAALRKYATFSGRAQRSEYWYFILFYLLIYAALLIAGAVVGSSSPILSNGLQLLGAIFSLAMLIPSLAVSVRRLHDTNRSGWWFLFSLVPIIGGIVLLIFVVQDSQPGENRFGPNPKGIADAKGGGATASGGISGPVIAAVVLLFVVFVGGILAAVAIPAYKDYQARVAISQALSELARFRPQLAELVNRTDSTASLAAAGISLAGNSNFSSLYYDPKSLTLVGNLAGPFPGRSIGIQYRRSAGESPQWICGSKDLEMKYLPHSCRNQIGYLEEREALNFRRAAPEPSAQVATAASAPAALPVQKAPTVTPAAAPAVPPTVAPAVAPTVARAVSPPRAESASPKPTIERRKEAAPRLQAARSACVYKPVMTDEDIAKCR